jgi:hypothetical protein
MAGLVTSRFRVCTDLIERPIASIPSHKHTNSYMLP